MKKCFILLLVLFMLTGCSVKTDEKSNSDFENQESILPYENISSDLMDDEFKKNLDYFDITFAETGFTTNESYNTLNTKYLIGEGNFLNQRSKVYAYYSEDGISSGKGFPNVLEIDVSTHSKTIDEIKNDLENVTNCKFDEYTISIPNTDYQISVYQVSAISKIDVYLKKSSAPRCLVDNCGKLGAYTLTGVSGELENYCAEHYSELKSNYDKITSDNNSDYDEKEIAVTDDNELGACWALATESVKNSLKSPSTAEFPFSYNSSGVSITKTGEIYTVKGWVDAQNSFGAMIRNDFIVKMKKNGNKMVLESVNIIE